MLSRLCLKKLTSSFSLAWQTAYSRQDEQKSKESKANIIYNGCHNITFSVQHNMATYNNAYKDKHNNSAVFFNMEYGYQVNVNFVSVQY